MIRTFQYKLYPNASQVKALDRWLGSCAWVYNRALENRIKAYKRRGESVTYLKQQTMLTAWRSRMDWLRLVPSEFCRDALRRVDRGFKAFFRRLKAGDKAVGFPRFRSRHRYNSLECCALGNYLQGDRVRVPNLGLIRCRGRLLPLGEQRVLRIIKRSSGWYAQIVLDDGKPVPEKRRSDRSVGIDVGLTTFATMSDGQRITNPRWLRSAERKLRALQRRVSRRHKGSNRRRKAVRAVRRFHELIADRRRSFAHQHSTRMIRDFNLIAVEKLNVKGMSRGRFAKSILDCAWSQFTSMLKFKAECAGASVVEVNARGTSQECPNCHAIKPKKLSERTHSCVCGLECDRDYAAAQVILARAVVATTATRPWTEPASDAALVAPCQADRMKRVNQQFTSAVS